MCNQQTFRVDGVVLPLTGTLTGTKMLTQEHRGRFRPSIIFFNIPPLGHPLKESKA
jgi:hypothetical protein